VDHPATLGTSDPGHRLGGPELGPLSGQFPSLGATAPRCGSVPAAMIDLSFDPIADASAVAALVLMWWQGRSGQKNAATV